MPATETAIVPLTAADVAGAVRVVVEALPPSGPPEPPEGRFERMRRRVQDARATDPGGAWVAHDDRGVVIGLALALRSDGIWILSLLAVSPRAQSGGVGRGLLAHSLRHADGCHGAMISSSQDPRAMRAYARAGFDLRPAVAAAGPVDRAALPAGLDSLVREVGSDGIAQTVPIDRIVRGGGRPAHIATLLEIPDARLYLADSGRGYAIGRNGRVFTVVATDEEAAQALLWRLLADTLADPSGEAILERVTAGQDWAVDVALRAGLSLRTDGPVFTRGRLGTLRPFLPTGAYL
ncbi:MAG TPA: GNAT family N-acetyltransferase [Conexibacter sp.]|jgi:GNAT superfamily N-acetyltransferase